MPSLTARILLFISSYAPLLCILSFKYWGNLNNIPSFTLLGVSFISVSALIYQVKVWSKRIGSNTSVITSIQRKDSEVMSYIVSYIFPYLSVNFSNFAEVMAFIPLYLVIGIVFVSSGLIHVNPMLNIFGYHIFEVETAGGLKTNIITNKRITVGKHVQLHRINDDIHVES